MTNRESDRPANVAHGGSDAREWEAGARAFAEKQRLLEMAETMSGVGHWRLDLATNKPTWSKAVYEIHGVRPETFNPELDSAIDFYHPDDRPLVVQKLDEATRSKSGFNFQLRLIRADGSLRHVASKGVCELDAAGEPIAIIGLFQDITEHVTAREAVEQSEKRYRMLAEHSTDLILRFGPSGIISYASPSCRILGVTPEQVIGRSTLEFVQPDQRDFAAQILTDLFNGEEPDRTVRREFRVLAGDGSDIWLEGNPSIIRDADGVPVEAITSYRDITARKALKTQLQQSLEAAEAATRAKADFLANMSHELRTPLTAMVGFTSLLQQQPELSDASQHCVERAMTAGRALMGIINDILDFSMLESGQVEIRRAPTDVTACIENLMSLLHPAAGEKGLELRFDLPRPLPSRLLVDPHSLQQIMMNLVGNAVKFTDAGSVLVRAVYDTGLNLLRIDVSDTGPGITPEGQAKLFQRFSQVDGSSTRRHGGSGLGLAICRGRVEANGGQIGVESQIGNGARFWFTLPAEIVTGHAIADTSRLQSPSPLDGVRVLVADDNPAVCDALNRILLSAGAEITLVADGDAARTIAAAQPFDVILLDLMMPLLDGVGAARAIREPDALNAAIPIIAMSAGIGADLPPGLFDDTIAKPVERASLIRMLTNLLDRQEKDAHAA